MELRPVIQISKKKFPLLKEVWVTWLRNWPKLNKSRQSKKANLIS